VLVVAGMGDSWFLHVVTFQFVALGAMSL
jgi:hypothetical protein